MIFKIAPIVGLVLILLTPAFPQQQLAIREKIIPLRSTRTDLELIARPSRGIGNASRYETSSEILEVEFAGQRCEFHGWDVPPDRVISYVSYPKTSLPREQLADKIAGYIRTSDHIGTIFLTNPTKGIEFVLRTGEVSVSQIRFTPTAADSGSRCVGFPKYNPVADNYSPYQKGVIKEARTWDPGGLAATFGKIRENPDNRGFIFVYFKKGNELEARIVIDTINKALDLNGGMVKEITVMEGGLRRNTEVESFIVSKNYPGAMPRPYFPNK